jgi:hypothetical protein
MGKSYTKKAEEILFDHYSKENLKSLLARIVETELSVPGLAKTGKFEEILARREDLEIVIKAVLYKPEHEIQTHRRNLQLKIQEDKSAEAEVNSYRMQERQLFVLNDLLYNGIIAKSTRTLLHLPL